jgi:hypothetical protein
MKTIILTACAAVTIAACGPLPQSAERADSEATERLQAEAQSQIGMPRIASFTEKRLATRLAELRDKPNLTTYAYVQGIDGKLTCFGKGIGFGIPYSTQITNPQRIARESSYGIAVTPQAEPNGLYMPESASATWYMLIDPASGEASPVYVEPALTVSIRPLTGPAIAAPCPR